MIEKLRNWLTTSRQRESELRAEVSRLKGANASMYQALQLKDRALRQIQSLTIDATKT